MDGRGWEGDQRGMRGKGEEEGNAYRRRTVGIANIGAPSARLSQFSLLRVGRVGQYSGFGPCAEKRSMQNSQSMSSVIQVVEATVEENSSHEGARWPVQRQMCSHVVTVSNTRGAKQ